MTIVLTKAKTAIIWRSPTVGIKTTSIPGSVTANNGYALDVITPMKNGDLHKIIPISGTIEGASEYDFFDNGGSASLLSDAANNDWIVVCLCGNLRA
jgi:hypothetical protein